MATQAQFEKALTESLADIGVCIGDGGGFAKPITRRGTQDILDLIGGQIQATLDEEMPTVRAMQQGKKAPSLTVRAIGKFAIRFKKATGKRMGRNPATGESIEIGPKPASRKLVVTAPKQLKEELDVL